jgi:cytochrome c-type biogenesis protein
VESSQGVTMLVAMGAGLLSFLSPCVLPLFPSYLAFIGGLSFDELRSADQSPRLRAQVVRNALAFILGFSVVFVALGASFSYVGQLLFRSQHVIRQIGGVLIILFGLYIAGVLRIPWLARERRFQLAGQQGQAVGAAIVGVTFGAAWTPCVGPILGSILLLATTTNSTLDGVKLLTAYSAGLAIPFFLASLAVERSLRFADRFKRWLPLVEKVAGALLVIMGILVFTNYVSVLNTYFIRLTPEWLWRRL